MHTYRQIGIDNRNDDNGETITEQTARADVLNSTASAVEENGSKVDSKIQAKSDIINYGSLNDDQFYDQQQYKSQSLYDYNTMHAPNSPYQQIPSIQQERGQSQKYSEPPKLEYLHAYQYSDYGQDGGVTGQELFDESEYSKQRLAPQLQQLQQLQVQQPQEQVSEIEISKSKQYSYSIRKPELSPFQSSFNQQPRAAALQQQQPQQQQQQQTAFQQHQFGNFGRETAYLKQTPATVVPQQNNHEEFKFQRINRPPVEKENQFDDYTKPVHIHHHYPVQHTEETEQPEQTQTAQQQPIFSQPIRSQFYPSSHSNQVKNNNQFGNNPFHINTDSEPTAKPYSSGYTNSESYIPARKQPVKHSWSDNTYELPTTTTRAPPPRWENPHHVDNTKVPVDEEQEQRPQVMYPNNIRIEIPEEEIYKHIQNSVHQIIRDLKEKRTKEQHHRGKPLANQDQSWSKFLMHGDENKEKQAHITFNKSSGSFEPFNPRAPEKDIFGQENVQQVEKPRDQSFHQYNQHHQQQPQTFDQSNPHRINSRHHEEDKPHVMQTTVNTFRFEEGFNVAPSSNSHRINEATQYESGVNREPVSSTVDITMKNPKKAPIIDLNALDVGQTWNHDSHFESIRENEQKQAFLNAQNRPTPSSINSYQSHHSGPMNFTFGSTIQPNYDQSRATHRVQTKYQQDSNGNTLAYVGSAMNVKDPFPVRTPSPTPAFFKGNQREPEVPEVDIMHGMLPVVNQFDNGHQVMKVILDPSKMPRELVTEVPSSSVFQQEFGGQFPGNVQTIQYNMNHQHLAVPIVHNNNNNQYNGNKLQPAHQTNFINQMPEQQNNYISYPKERKSKAMSSWANNIPEGSANVIQYLPPPPMPASRSLLPYDSYSPIYNEDLSLGKAISSSILRNKRHRGSEEYKKIIRTTYPRSSKKMVKTVKILEPSTEMKPPPKFNKFSKKSSTN